MGVEQGGRVPHQDAERAAPAAPGGRELGLARLRGGHARRAQEAAGYRTGEAGRGERLHEMPACEAALPHLRQHLPKGRFVHGFPVGGSDIDSAGRRGSQGPKSLVAPEGIGDNTAPPIRPQETDRP